MTTHVPKQDAERAIEAAERFLQAAKSIIIDRDEYDLHETGF